LAADERIAAILLDEGGDQNKIRISKSETISKKSKKQKLSKQKMRSQTPFDLVNVV
jgi:hypothetical protein